MGIEIGLCASEPTARARRRAAGGSRRRSARRSLSAGSCIDEWLEFAAAARFAQLPGRVRYDGRAAPSEGLYATRP
jgi:hypothetical protein